MLTLPASLCHSQIAVIPDGIQKAPERAGRGGGGRGAGSLHAAKLVSPRPRPPDTPAEPSRPAPAQLRVFLTVPNRPGDLSSPSRPHGPCLASQTLWGEGQPQCSRSSSPAPQLRTTGQLLCSPGSVPGASIARLRPKVPLPPCDLHGAPLHEAGTRKKSPRGPALGPPPSLRTVQPASGPVTLPVLAPFPLGVPDRRQSPAWPPALWLGLPSSCHTLALPADTPLQPPESGWLGPRGQGTRPSPPCGPPTLLLLGTPSRWPPCASPGSSGLPGVALLSSPEVKTSSTLRTGAEEVPSG